MEEKKLFKCWYCKNKFTRKEFTLFTPIVKICIPCASAAKANDVDKKLFGKFANRITPACLRDKLKKQGHTDENIEEGLKRTGFRK